MCVKHSCTNHNHVHVEIISCNMYVISKIVSDCTKRKTRFGERKALSDF
jgi:hypothetical protein